MTNITEIISKEAEKHGIKLGRYVSGNYNTENDRENSFIDGAVFATTDPSVLAELLGKFAEWQNKNYSQSVTNTGLWYGREGLLTTEELIYKYIQFITDNKNETGSNKTM